MRLVLLWYPNQVKYQKKRTLQTNISCVFVFTRNSWTKTNQQNPVTYGKIYSSWPSETYLKNAGWFNNQGQEWSIYSGPSYKRSLPLRIWKKWSEKIKKSNQQLHSKFTVIILIFCKILIISETSSATGVTVWLAYSNPTSFLRIQQYFASAR